MNPKRRYHDGLREKAAQLRADGLSMGAIATALDVGKSTICEWLRGVPSGKMADDPKVEAGENLRSEVIRLYLDEGMDLASTKETTGARWNQVHRWILEIRQCEADAKVEALRKLPPDTRTPGQILMGEPVYERSALYQKQMVAKSAPSLFQGSKS